MDVGVNIGQSLLKLRSVNSNISYYGFEPNPTCVYYVRELIKVNKLTNVTLFPVGISDTTSIYELSFFDEDNSDSSATMLNNFRPNQKIFRKQYIACFNIPEILLKHSIPSIGILKIDVEGAEKEVIEGFKDKIISDQPVIQLEILPVYSRENEKRLKRQEALEHFFKTINYTMLRIHFDDRNRFTHLEEIETIDIHSNLNWCEYLVVPNSIKEAIKSI